MKTMWAALVIAMCLGCGVEPEPAPCWPPANVLLVAEDTTRAILVEKVYIQQDSLGEITVLLAMGDSLLIFISPADCWTEPIIVDGELTGMDASGGSESWADGDSLYMSDTGGLTNTHTAKGGE